MGFSLFSQNVINKRLAILNQAENPLSRQSRNQTRRLQRRRFGADVSALITSY
jgi:hypothetical protein